MSSSFPQDSRALIATADQELSLRLAEVLAAQHYTGETAGSAPEAMKILLDRNPPRIALVDAALPGQSGIEIAAEIKRRSLKKQTWIMLLSSAPDSATISAATDAGVDDLLLCPKGQPFNQLDLRARLSVAERVQALTRDFEAQMQAVSFHALHDNLTGLWNRESLLSLLFPETDRVQRMGTPLGFLLLDLDHFARINAEYGYEAGDKILQEFADRLRRYLRSYDLIGRCGEDEFLIVLPGCTSSQTLQLAGRIRSNLLHRPFPAGRDMITLTASMGISQSRGRSPLVVLREAERALTTAKLDGRNCEREFAPLPQKREIPWEEQLAAGAARK